MDLKLENGKTYIARNGNIIKVEKREDIEKDEVYKFKGLDKISFAYLENGRIYDDQESLHDLISEAVLSEPVPTSAPQAGDLVTNPFAEIAAENLNAAAARDLECAIRSLKHDVAHIQTVTLRDEFAIAALTGLLASDKYTEEGISEVSYEIADAMLKARKQ